VAATGTGTHSLAEADRALLEALDVDFERARRRAGAWLACRPGCSDCCFGPFPITPLDTWRLRRGLERLRAEDPSRADRVEERARRAALAMTSGYPGDPSTGRLDANEATLDRFFSAHRELACPALDPRTGCCELHAARPVACRTYGPPLLFGDERAPALI
jgi:Fe-S-cluster containining protein